MCTASDWFGSARIPYVLHEAGCTVTVLGEPSFLIARSRYVKHRVPAPVDPAAVALAVRDHLAQRATPYALVLPADDPLLHALSKHAGESWLDGVFPVDHRTPARELVVGKNAFMARASEAGLPVPRSIACTTHAEAASAARTIGYPVMVKSDLGWGGGEVAKADDDQQLHAAVELMPPGESFGVQEYIDGRLGIMHSIFDHGRPLYYHVMSKELMWPTPFSISTERVALYPDDAVAVLTALGKL